MSARQVGQNGDEFATGEDLRGISQLGAVTPAKVKPGEKATLQSIRQQQPVRQ